MSSISEGAASDSSSDEGIFIQHQRGDMSPPETTESIYDKVIDIPNENDLRSIVDSFFSVEGGAYAREHVGGPIISKLSGKSLNVREIASILNTIENGKYAASDASHNEDAATATATSETRTSLIGYKLLSLFCDRETMGLLWLKDHSSQDLLPLNFAEMLIDTIIERPKGESLSANEGRLSYFGPMPCLSIHRRFLTFDIEDKASPPLCPASNYFGRLANIASSLTHYHNFVPALLHAAKEHCSIMSVWSKWRIITALKRYRDISTIDPEYESFHFAFNVCKELIPSMWKDENKDDTFTRSVMHDALGLIANLRFDTSDGGDGRVDALAELIPIHLSKTQIVRDGVISRIVMILARAATAFVDVNGLNSCTIDSPQLPFQICCKYEKYAAQWSVHVVDEQKDINWFVYG